MKKYYDVVYFTCPKCNYRMSKQSRAGDRDLSWYNEEHIPLKIAGDIIDKKIQCENCKTVFKIAKKTNYIKKIPLKLIEI